MDGRILFIRQPSYLADAIQRQQGSTPGVIRYFAGEGLR